MFALGVVDKRDESHGTLGTDKFIALNLDNLASATGIG